jgi:hypothetical protein
MKDERARMITNGTDLLRAMTATTSEGGFTKVIPFRNDDVPNFLKKLAAFEEESKKNDLLIH